MGRAAGPAGAAAPLRCWISLLALTALEAVQVSVRDERRFALLFQPVVLPCQYSSVSSQTPVVQWWYKSFCRDRTRDVFRFPDALGPHGSDLDPLRDCGDGGRTVRIVASGQGSAITLAEHYKGRDIAIINKADLRIGELQWGDSGVYFCKVVIVDDLEGQNEAHVELLVLGQTGLADDLLPGFNVDFVPEWVFVCAVVLGALLLVLLVGVCWCQCCPHSCCCYVRCCCCPETCCCPRHLYEAGKGLKSPAPTPVPVLPPFFVPGMPTMMPIAPPSLIAASLENGSAVRSVFPAWDQSSLAMLQLVEDRLAQIHPSQTHSSPAPCGRSELSSLHDVETDLAHVYGRVQKTAPPAIAALEAELGITDLEHRGPALEPNHRGSPGSELLPRRALAERRTGSVDELEEFASAYLQRGRSAHTRDREDRERPPPHCSKPHSPRSSPARRERRDPGGSRGGYDHSLLHSVLQRRAQAGRRAGRPEEDSDAPSRKSSERFHSPSPSSRSPRQRAADDSQSLPPDAEERERSRPGHEEPRSRRVSSELSRDALLV